MADEDHTYLYDWVLVVGAAQHGVLALVIIFCDTLDCKRKMPVVPATPNILF